MNKLGHDITTALRVLRRGGVILYPTDTIWGLGCAVSSEEGMRRIAQIKDRPSNRGFILLVSSFTMLAKYVGEYAVQAEVLASKETRPLTIVYPRAEGIPPHALGTDGSVAIRVVHHLFNRVLIENLQEPITSTSANFSGEVPPGEYASVAPSILHQVDYTVPTIYDTAQPQHASRIIRLEEGQDLHYTVLRS